MTQQHSDWAPSSLARILSCPASAEAVKLFKSEEDNEAANLGTEAAKVLEDCIMFGIEPQHEDVEIVEGIRIALEYVNERIREGYEIYAEKKLSIPNSPIWGTADVIAVDDRSLEIADYKHGYVPVEVKLNAQLMAYLRGAIYEFGERKKYKITVLQPRYDHRDGPIRSYLVTEVDIEWFDNEVKWAVENQDVFKAGKHCKYCPARGACNTFAVYISNMGHSALAYDLTNSHTFDDNTLARLLDFSDLIPGWINELRKEGLKRIFNNREIPGYKVVTGKVTREWGESAPENLPTLYEKHGLPTNAVWERKLASPATVEKHFKAHYKRQEFKDKWEEVKEYIENKEGGPSLVKDIDGRPKYMRGSEFGELPASGDIEL